MSKNTCSRTYGRSSKRSRAPRLLAELPQSPLRHPPEIEADDAIADVSSKLELVRIADQEHEEPRGKRPVRAKNIATANKQAEQCLANDISSPKPTPITASVLDESQAQPNEQSQSIVEADGETSLRVLAWDDVCPPEDCIQKIAEASSAEVYRVTNERGTSIIKVIRLPSPIKAQTKAQINARLIDEEPQPVDDVRGELQISEWSPTSPGSSYTKSAT